MYRVLDKFAHLPMLVCPLPNGRRVNLLGFDVITNSPATKEGPGIKIIIRGATQEEMKYFYEQPGTRLIEYVPSDEEE